MRYVAQVQVVLKPGIFDAEGSSVEKALGLLGFESMKGVQSVKTYNITLEKGSEAAARKDVEKMCQELLANPVVHNYTISFLGDK